jgi:hypothetical protein
MQRQRETYYAQLAWMAFAVKQDETLRLFCEFGGPAVEVAARKR